MEPKVYIVIVNYKNPIDTVECLESVLKLEYSNCSIIVVDNSEDDNSVDYIKTWAIGETKEIATQFPELVYPLAPKPLDFEIIHANQGRISDCMLTILLTDNRGFAAGNNDALKLILKQKDFSYVWLLNNDTVIDPMSLSYLVKQSTENSKVGIMGSKLMKYYKPTEMQGVGARYNKWIGKTTEIGAGEIDNGQYDRQMEFDYVIGASMLVKREFLATVGVLEEDFFLYFEELDWALRGAKKGWRLNFCSNAIVFHKMGASISKEKGKSSLISDFYMVRNRILVSKKYYPHTLPFIYLSMIMVVFNRILRNQFDRIGMILRILLNPKSFYKRAEDN